MRIINADELVYNRYYDIDETGTQMPVWAVTEEDIRNARTLEDVQARYGQWKLIYREDCGYCWQCSACKGYRFQAAILKNKYKYCPNCGAKMGE